MASAAQEGRESMIKIESVDVCGWEAAIRGMRNPKNSWNKSDSHLWESTNRFEIGENDLALMQTLANAGTDHGKFLRMITVTLDITAPLYWWKEFDTYKVGTVANSCSTMHKIHAKEFTLDDFSHEHLIQNGSVIVAGHEMPYSWAEELEYIVCALNLARDSFIRTGDKKYWWQLIQLLPSSYNQCRTVMLNYAVLKNMYQARLAHKLDEWVEFCSWVTTLPYSALITGKAVE